MRHLLAIILTAVLVLGTAVPIQAQEPDRIVSALTVAGVSPFDQPVYVPTGTVDVVVDTTLTCTPPPDKVGCGVIVAAVLHSPFDGDYPVYPDILDQTSSVPCGDGYAPGCQAPAGQSRFTYTFEVSKPGVFILEIWTIAAFDFNTDSLLLTTDYPVNHSGATYPEGQMYTAIGYVPVVVEEVYAA